jgi:hypothetical protein
MARRLTRFDGNVVAVDAMTLSQWTGISAALLAVSMGVSCSGRSDRLATVPVRGTVMYQGMPVAGATVAFLAPGAPRHAVGTTDDAGRFRLTTFEPGDGAIVGRHVVTVTKASGDAPAIPATPPGEATDAAAIDRAMDQAAEAHRQARKGPGALPEKYASERTSDLHVDVTESENEVELVLSD